MKVKDFENATNSYEKGLEIAEAINYKSGVSILLANLGSLYFELRNYELALYYQENALEIFREISDKFGEGGQLGNIGIIYEEMGEKIKPEIIIYKLLKFLKLLNRRMLKLLSVI